MFVRSLSFRVPRFALAVSLAPTFDRFIAFLMKKTGRGKAFATGLCVFLVNVLGTLTLMTTGILLASLFSGQCVCPCFLGAVGTSHAPSLLSFLLLFPRSRRFGLGSLCWSTFALASLGFLCSHKCPSQLVVNGCCTLCPSSACARCNTTRVWRHFAAGNESAAVVMV